MKKFLLSLAVVGFATALTAQTMVTFTVTVPVTDPAVTYVSIAGNRFEPNWAPGEEAAVLTQVDATTFTITLDCGPDTVGMQYKYCAGPAWDYVEVIAGNGNRTYTGATDVVDTFTAVYVPVSLTNVSAASAIVSAGAGVITASFEGVATVEVYTVTGVKVASASAEGQLSVPVSAGAYIVVVNGVATKVIVK